jgi:hypothetical protein
LNKENSTQAKLNQLQKTKDYYQPNSTPLF